MDRNKYMHQIMALELCLIDLNQYLDTHTFDTDMIEMFNDYKAELKSLVDRYEAEYGPLTPSTTRSDYWNWTQDPWPWENMSK